jgi:uncharacterized membrane protein
MVLDPEVGGPPGGKILVAIYAAALYAAYHQVRTRKAPEWLMGCLFGGHVAAMAAAWHLLGDRVAISVSWGVLALVCLGVSFLMKDVFLGNSSLLVYGISSAKVFLFDLSGAQPLVRIGSLVALGLSLYVGGLLYRRLNERPGDPVPGSAA